MNARSSVRSHSFAAVCCGMVLLIGTPAHADAIDDAASVLDAIHLAAPGALPFDGDKLRHYRDLIVSCGSSSSADDVLACVDEAAKSDVGQAEIPEWLPQMIDVYFDIEHKDFWGLLEDTGKDAACAAAQLVAGGVEVCGAVNQLVDAATVLAGDVAAVARFFADLGTSIVADISCWLGSCGDPSPPPAPEEAAYQEFFLPHLDEGLAMRMIGPAARKAYAGTADTSTHESSTNEPAVITKNEPAKFSHALLLEVLPRFRAAVYVQWDSTIIGKTSGNVIKVSMVWSSLAKARGFVAAGMAVWKPDMALDFSTELAPLLKPGRAACAAALAKAGGQQVDDWVQEGRVQAAAQGFKWPSSYRRLCQAFDLLLQAALRPQIVQQASTARLADCKNQGGDPPTYLCGNQLETQACTRLMKFAQSQASCKSAVNGPGTIQAVCIDKKPAHPENLPLRKGCQAAKLSDPPATPGTGQPPN
jgi:hypothetical protein